MAGSPSSERDDAVALVQACAQGDGTARRAFQDRFAEDIYNFPVKIYGLPPDKAADFYVYAFERDRIFTRLRTFEGRGGMQLRTFLAYHVLRGLFLDWQRREKDLDTVSLQAPLRPGATMALEDVLPAPETEAAPPAAGEGAATELWASLGPEERLDLKLLSLLDHELGADDLRLLARISGRGLDETLAAVGELQAELQDKDAELADLTAELDSTWGWLVLRRRELQETNEKIRLLGRDDGSQKRRLAGRREELERAIAKREHQHRRLLGEIRGYKVTTSYKHIARLKNSTVGTVCSRIFRLRQRIEDRWQALEAST
jgi:RNA polymerase sigma factor (sigma-70 family)